MKNCLLLLVLLSACVAGTYAIQCYVCTGALSPIALNGWCNDPFDEAAAKASIQTCSGPCVKTYSKISEDLEGYIRECSNVTLPDCLNDCASYAGITGCQHCCTTALCNGAGHVAVNLLAAVAMLVSARALTS